MNDLTFEQVYRDNFNAIYNFVYMKVMNRENAEDIVSDTFIKAMTHFADFDPAKAGVRTWLCTIANNTVIDYFRKSARQATDSLDEPDAVEPSTVDHYSVWDDPVNQEVARLMGSLRQEEREILAMRYQMDLSNPEIAQILGINAKAVSERLRRALAKCKQLEDQAGNEAADFL